jgi:hypothetical protein
MAPKKDQQKGGKADADKAAGSLNEQPRASGSEINPEATAASEQESGTGASPEAQSMTIDPHQLVKDLTAALDSRVPRPQAVGARSGRLANSAAPSVASSAVSGIGVRRSHPQSSTAPPAKRAHVEDPDWAVEDLVIDEESEEEAREIEGLKRLRFKTPASINRRVKAARDDLLKATPEELNKALVGFVEAKCDQFNSHLSTVRSEARNAARQTAGRLNSLASSIERIEGFSRTAAQDREPIALKSQWQADCRLPWESLADVEYVGSSRQLRSTLEQYVCRFVDLAPDVIASFLEHLVGEGLRGRLYMPDSPAKVVWGVLAEPLPEFVPRLFSTLSASEASLRGPGEGPDERFRHTNPQPDGRPCVDGSATGSYAYGQRSHHVSG